MLKAVGLVVAGLLAGLAVAWLWPVDEAANGGDLASGDFLPSTSQGATLDERFAGMQEVLRSEVQAHLVLEERVEALSAELTALREDASQVSRRSDESIQGPRPSDLEEGNGVRTLTLNAGRAPLSADERVARETERDIDRLIAAGFSRDRAEQLHRRSDELNFEVMQAHYEARRAGQPVDNLPTRDQLLRRELGDADYERVLRATGRLMEVSVISVMSGSPAELVGLKPGDRILSYAGTRIFGIDEINPLTTQGNPGETVVVEVLRDGQPLQLALPRGPMGVQLQGTRDDGGAPSGRAGRGVGR